MGSWACVLKQLHRIHVVFGNEAQRETFSWGPKFLAAPLLMNDGPETGLVLATWNNARLPVTGYIEREKKNKQ